MAKTTSVLEMNVAMKTKEKLINAPIESRMSSDAMIEPPMSRELENLNEDIDSEQIEEDLAELAEDHAHGRPTFSFLEEDDEFQKVLAEGGENPSICVDKWALNRLNSYREFKGLGTDVSLPDMADLQIVALLTKFFEQVCKLDGSYYPSQSLMSMYRAFHRILIQHQNLRIGTTRVNKPPRSLKNNPVFYHVGVACVMSMKQSRNVGANLPRKKARVISLDDEKIILNHVSTSIVHPRGLQKRAAYYLLSRFCIRGGIELYNVRANDFRFGVDIVNRYIRYDERHSKNYKVSLTQFQEEHFCPPIVEYDLDVINTLDKLITHLPTSMPKKDRFLFYQAIDNPRTISWYSSSRVASRNLGKWLKNMHTESGLSSDGVTNKLGRTTCVTRMAAEGVPSDVGMLITGHKSTGSYARYDRSSEARVRAAQRCVADGSSFIENVIVQTKLLKETMVRGESSRRVKLKTQEAALVSAPLTMNFPRGLVATVMESSANLVNQHALNQTSGAETSVVQRPVMQPPMKQPTLNETNQPIDGAFPIVDGGRGGADEPVNVQTTAEYGNWAGMVNWDAVEGDMAARGLIVAKIVNNNPVTALFGQIRSMANYNITINFGSNSNNGDGPATPNLASFLRNM